MKRVWLSKKFSYIYEASPSSNLAFFMQSLYSHAIGMFNSMSTYIYVYVSVYVYVCVFQSSIKEQMASSFSYYYSGFENC